MKPKTIFCIVDQNGDVVLTRRTEKAAIALASTQFRACKVVEYKAVMRKPKPIVGFDLVD